MMGIAEDMQARLRAALPDEIPVLLPYEQRTPLEAAPLDAQGRPVVGAGERGLGAYLKAHPAGYVQIEQPAPIGSDGTTATYWVAVASFARSAGQAQALARRVRLALSGTSPDPGPHAEVLAAQPAPIQGGVWMVRPTFDALTVDGEHAAPRSNP